MRFGEGSIAAQHAATPYVAYLSCESSVRGYNSHFARQLLDTKGPGRDTQRDLAVLGRRSEISRRSATTA